MCPHWTAYCMTEYAWTMVSQEFLYPQNCAFDHQLSILPLHLSNRPSYSYLGWASFRKMLGRTLVSEQPFSRWGRQWSHDSDGLEMFSRNIRLRRRWLKSNGSMCLFCYQHLNNCFLSTSAHKSWALPYKTRPFCWPGFLGLVPHEYKCFRLARYSSVSFIGLSYLFSPVQGLDDNVTFIKHNLLHTCLCLFITLVFHSRNSLPCVFTHISIFSTVVKLGWI